MALATFRARHGGTAPAYIRAHNRGSRCRTATASPTSLRTEVVVIASSAAISAIANSSTNGAPSPPNGSARCPPGCDRIRPCASASMLYRSARCAASTKMSRSARSRTRRSSPNATNASAASSSSTSAIHTNHARAHHRHFRSTGKPLCTRRIRPFPLDGNGHPGDEGRAQANTSVRAERLHVAPGIILVIVGAILAFAVRTDASAVDIQTVGLIFMIAGAAIIAYARREKRIREVETRVEQRLDASRAASHGARDGHSRVRDGRGGPCQDARALFARAGPHARTHARSPRSERERRSPSHELTRHSSRRVSPEPRGVSIPSLIP